MRGSWCALCLLSTVATAQPQQQQAKDCSQNFIGNNNIGTITCYAVDKQLAAQLAQLVGASRRDTKTLKDISAKLEEMLQLIASGSARTVSSVNQRGGITVGQIEQHSQGPNSPNIVGSGNSVTITAPPRVLSDHQKAILTDALRPYSGQPVHIFALFSDSESQALSAQFVEVFKAAGWSVKQHIFAMTIPPPMNIGIWAGVKDPTHQTPGEIAFGECVVKTLHMDVRGQSIADAEEGHFYVWIGMRQ